MPSSATAQSGAMARRQEIIPTLKRNSQPPRLRTLDSRLGGCENVGYSCFCFFLMGFNPYGSSCTFYYHHNFPFLCQFHVYIYRYVRWTFMYYLTVDYLIPFQIESNLPDAKKRFGETFGRSSLYFEYFEYF